MTTILGAGKLLGETKKGTKFGIIEAVTDEEYGVWEHEVGDSLVREKILLEPRSNYFIGRVEQPVFNSLSTVGLMVTDLRRNNAGYSNVLGLDWNIRFLNNALSIRGQLVHSSKDRTSGDGARIFVGYLNPEWWELKFFTGYKDKTFEINDLGFDWLYSNWYYGVDGGIRKQKPWGRFLKNDLKIKEKFNFKQSAKDLLITSKLILLPDLDPLIEISYKPTLLRYPLGSSFQLFGFEPESLPFVYI